MAPNVAANPLRTWAATSNLRDQGGPVKDKAARFSGVLTNDLFGGRARSQTVFGADYLHLTRTALQSRTW